MEVIKAALPYWNVASYSSAEYKEAARKKFTNKCIDLKALQRAVDDVPPMIPLDDDAAACEEILLVTTTLTNLVAEQTRRDDETDLSIKQLRKEEKERARKLKKQKQLKKQALAASPMEKREPLMQIKSNSVPYRYGLNCTRTDCWFDHSQSACRPATATSTSSRVVVEDLVNLEHYVRDLIVGTKNHKLPFLFPIEVASDERLLKINISHFLQLYNAQDT